jgi:hypothetical protein
VLEQKIGSSEGWRVAIGYRYRMPNAHMALSLHPVTGEWEEAEWYQKEIAGRYFVKFGDGEIFDTQDVAVETKKSEPMASFSLDDEPVLERKDVVIQVNAIDVELKEGDEATARAKEVIETEVFPRLSNADVVVTVMYREPIDGKFLYASKMVKIPHVRQYAEACVQSFIQQFVPTALPSDFAVVEYYKLTDEVKITKL